MKTLVMLFFRALLGLALVLAQDGRGPCGCIRSFDFCANDLNTYYSICEYQCKNPSTPFQEWYILSLGPCLSQPAHTVALIGRMLTQDRREPCSCKRSFDFCANDYDTYHSICEYKCKHPSTPFKDWYILYYGPCLSKPTEAGMDTTTDTTTDTTITKDMCVKWCKPQKEHYDSGAPYPEIPEPDYVFKPEADAWLRLHTRPAIWSEAGMGCFLEGGTLASPTTSAMARTMTAMMAKHKLGRGIFTGINSILSKGNFKALDGLPLSSIPLSWAPGQPDNANSDEDCVMLTGAGKLADVSCERVLPYFCRKENKCGANDNGYNWEPRTGSCYKFHRFAKIWRKALSTCHAEGGHLAIINSQTESTVLKEIYDKNTKHTIIEGAHNVNYVFIGINKYDGNWATIHGDTLAEAGFEEWMPGEPNNPETELCGSIGQDGRFNDLPCSLKFTFICEMTPVRSSNAISRSTHEEEEFPNTAARAHDDSG